MMPISRRKLMHNTFTLGASALAAGIVQAQHGSHAPATSQPVAIEQRFSRIKQAFTEPAVISSTQGVLDTRLRVMREQNQVGGKKLAVGRTYNGRLTGPTLKIKPGDQLRITLINDLDKHPKQSPDWCNHHTLEHCQDHTNIHTHGMHVSPSGIEDNVMIDVAPGEHFNYQINVPSDHYPGIAWYHPHRHGTVAKQVMEGMAGAIIIEGGLDELPQIRAARDQVFVMQQLVIPGNQLSNILPITINGQLLPQINAMPGELLRWRFVHATTIDFIELALKGPDGNTIPLHVIAEDGMALGRIDSKSSHFLNPGNRAEILVQPQQPGHYQLVKLAQEKGLRDLPDAGQVLAHIYIDGPKQSMAMPSAADVAGLAPFAAISDKELTGQQPDLLFKGTSGAVAIDDKPFAPGRVDRYMHVDDVEQWTLRSATGSHPFHIHVNPFQVVKINGKPVEKPMWRDVVLVKSEWQHGVTIRTRYKRFTGLTVLHCHNLVHEDKGMMQLIELLPARTKTVS